MTDAAVTTAPTATEHPEPRHTVGTRAGRTRSYLLVSAPYLIAALATFAVALWTYRPWRLRGVIAFPWGDSLSFHAWIQATLDSGWYESSDRLAFPSVQNGHTYVVTDEFLFAVIGKVLAPLTGGAAGGVLWWVILCFPATALVCVGLARYLGLGRVVAVVPGIVFPLLPDHFLRGTAHISLSSIWAVPLGLWLAVSLLQRPSRRGRRRVVIEVLALLGGIAIALTNAYYATFTMILVACAGVGASLVARSWRVLALGVGRGLSLLLPIVAAIALDNHYAPKVLGYTSFAITRSPSDAETYGGKIIAMLLPAQNHRLAYFRDIRHHYDTVFPNPAEYPTLGFVASIGFVGLVVWSILAYWRHADRTRDRLLSTLAGFNWIALLAYSVGGLGSIWAFVLNGGGIRVWSRMHVFIALIALLAVAAALSRISRRWLRVGVVALVVLVAVVDQTSPYTRPNVESARAVAAELRTFTSEIAGREGEDAALYQYPQVSFPVTNRETPGASPYDNFLPYLYSDHLKWSFGGYQGEPSADWQESMAVRPIDVQAALLASSGFSGVVVDTSAASGTPDLMSDIEAFYGSPDLVSSSGRWQYYDLNSETPACDGPAQSALEDEALHPPILYPGENMVLTPTWTWLSEDAASTSLRFLTEHESGWPSVTASFRVQSPSDVVVTSPDGTTQDVAAGSGETVTWTGPVDPSGTTIQIETADGEPAQIAVAELEAAPVPTAATTACVAAWDEQISG